MFYIQNPSELDKPWILSKDGSTLIPREVTKFLKNYHIMAIEFLYQNYCRRMKGSILNLEPDMNLPLIVSAFFRALVQDPAIILIICSRDSYRFWQHHLTTHANFEVLQISSKNSKDNFEAKDTKLALLLTADCLKLCEDLVDCDFLSIVIENLDQIAVKRIIKKMESKFNIGLTFRSFYISPDQKLQWSMMNWSNPGCVGKLNDFYKIDNRNFENFVDNYRHWWLRLTWNFCESFVKPSSEDLDVYKTTIPSPTNPTENLEKRPKKRQHKSDDSRSSTVPKEKYVKLPSMDENPILTSIKKIMEISPEPILPKPRVLPSFTQTRPNCSKYDDDDDEDDDDDDNVDVDNTSVIFSFLDDDDKAKPSTSHETITLHDSEQFIINLIGKSDSEETHSQDINDILKKADTLLQN